MSDKKTLNLLHLKLESAVVVLSTVSQPVYNQTFRNGHWYSAMPMPEPPSSSITTISKITSGCGLTDPGDSEIFPHTAVVKLFIRRGTEHAVASGVLIGRRFVLTAGHVVFKPGYGWADNIEVVPAYHDGKAPFGSARAVSFLAWDGWTKQKDFDYDIGLIVLDKNMGDCTGWFGFGAQPDDNFFLTREWRGLSYPAANGWDGEYLQFWYGTLSEVNGNTVGLNCKAVGGSSGGALYYKDHTGKRYVYGVYSHGNMDYTGFARLTTKMFYDIKNEMNKWGAGSSCR